MMTKIVSDDEAEIEAEIRRELEALVDDELEVDDLEDDHEDSSPRNLEGDNVFPASLEEYLRAIQSRTEGVAEDVNECDAILESLPLDNDKNEEELLAKKIREALGNEFHETDPLALRTMVLSEINEAELNEEKERLRNQAQDNNMAVDIVRPDVLDEIHTLEEAAEQLMRELEEKQAAKTHHRMALYDEMRKEEEARMEKEREERKHQLEDFEEAQKILNQLHEALQVKLELETIQEEKKLQVMQQHFQTEIKEIEEEQKKEQQALEEMQIREAKYQEKRRHAAATRLQKFYRGHRVYKLYRDVLEDKHKERLRRREEEFDRIERVEKKYRDNVELKKKAEEERMKKELEEKKRKGEENKRNEERKRREKEEMKKREDEQRKKEEIERKIKEEERKRIEEEERKKREDHIERKLKEDEERRLKEENRRREEEEKRRLEIEMKQKEEEEQIELEERRRNEEQKKIHEDEERQKAEEERRQKEECDRRKRQEELEQGKRRKEESERLEEQRRNEEELKRQQESKGRTNDKHGPYQQELSKIVLLVTQDTESRTAEGDKSISSYPGLTDSLEERRQQWVREHTPWSTLTFEGRVHPVAKARLKARRPFSASRNLPSLVEDQLLKSSPPGTPLYKVLRVCVNNWPACNMQGMSRCPDLKSLSMQDCGVMAVEGLEECKGLLELNVQRNKVEYVNCRDLHKLEELSLSNNSLTSVQGLESCTGLRSLDLANNKITRLGDISSCNKVQKLVLDHNQLIMTKGLSSLPCLQSFTCSNNHLPHIKDIGSCQLLQLLNLQANNLQQPPSLTNHVLLRELKLDDNSISTLEPLAEVWLPLLQYLSVSQNSISCIDLLNGVPLLTHLDISHNLISDMEGVVPGLRGCSVLRALKLEGNPVAEDPQCREVIAEALPFLSTLDKESVRTEVSSPDSLPSFINMCKLQLRAQDDVLLRHQRERSMFQEDSTDPAEVTQRLALKSKHFNEWHDLAVEHLQQHERFDDSRRQNVSITEEVSAAVGNNDGESELIVSHTGMVTDLHSYERKRNDAATKIQALWRGWNIRHRIDVQIRRWLAAVTIQAVWRGYSVRTRPRRPRVSRVRKALWDVRHHAAATTIQACYRGYRIRNRLARALRAYSDEDIDEDDFNYDEEVDLTAFDFDEGELEKGWTPSDTPQLPSRGPVLPSAGSSRGKSLHKDSPPETNEPWRPRQAWRSADSPRTDGTSQPRQRHGILPIPLETPEQDLMSVTSGTQSHLANRVEEYSSEWGFKNPSTAELMWKRANRMKYNPARKRKLLDPNKRLALFKKLDEANKLKEVKPPLRRQTPQRMEYFAARGAASLPSGSNTPTSERETKAQMTYSWVYNQGVVHQDQQATIMGDRRDYAMEPQAKKPPPHRSSGATSRSPISLPHMDPVVLTGRNVPLVSSPSLLQDQVSRNSTPIRRNSSSEEVHFPPIKTYSVPNLTARSAASQASGHSPDKSNSAGARMTKERRQRR